MSKHAAFFRSVATAGCALTLAATAPLAAQQSFNTQQTSVGATISGIGRASDGSAYTTLVQTFVAPTGYSYLQSFSLYLTESFGGADTRFHAYVYAFDGNLTAINLGQQLYRSSEFAGSSNIFGYDTFTFATTNLQLTPSAQYALVLSASEPFLNIPDFSTTYASGTDTDEYADGSLFGAFNNEAFADLGVSGTLAPVAGSPDLSFSATFSSQVVPEPSTVSLFAAGLVGLVGVSYRRRRR